MSDTLFLELLALSTAMDKTNRWTMYDANDEYAEHHLVVDSENVDKWKQTLDRIIKTL